MAAAVAAPRPRTAAEAALEALTAEVVRHYRAVGDGIVPPALIEAIGERLACAPTIQCPLHCSPSQPR